MPILVDDNRPFWPSPACIEVLQMTCIVFSCPKKRYRSKLVTYDSRQYVLGTDGALITGTIELHADETGAVHYTPRGE